MNKTYQLDYAAGRPQMYDSVSRIQKAKRIVKTLENELGKDRISNMSILDLGSSTGIIDNVLAKNFKSVIGTDIDKKAIEFANKKFKSKNLKFQVADAMKLNFQDKSFDVVICTHVYEHVPNAKKLFDEIYRVLKPGGVCYLAAQNRLWPWEPHYNLFFLSYLPKVLANLYLKIARGVDTYHESPKSYWGLKNLTQKFNRIELTQKILTHPQNYGYDDSLKPFSLNAIAAYLFSPLAKYFFPTFFWLLKKNE